MSAKQLLNFKNLQKQAQQNQLGIYKKPFQIFSLVYTNKNFIGIVIQIIEGHIYKIKNKKGQTLKIQLNTLICPVQKQLGAFQCRQFARKNLIGKEINVYPKKQGEFNLFASVVRASDNKDIETMMIENGYGTIVEEFKGSIAYSKLEKLANKSKQARKGIYNEEQLGYPHFQDLTIALNKKDVLLKEKSLERKMVFLEHVQDNMECVLEKSVGATFYIVRIDSLKKIIRVRLQGVSQNRAYPALPQAQQLVKYIQQFQYNNLNQRTGYLTISDYEEETDSYVGILKIHTKGKKTPIQHILLEKGIVYIHQRQQKQWLQLQEIARKAKINIWTDKLKNFNRINLIQILPNQFQGQITWIQNRQLAYIQPKSENRKLDNIYKQLNGPKLNKIAPENIKQGNLCVCDYQKQFYRAIIVAIKPKHIHIQFMDWGNRQNVTSQRLNEMPINLQYVPSLCCEVRVNIKALKTVKKEFFEKRRDQFLNKSVRVRKNYGNIVDLTFLK